MLGPLLFVIFINDLPDCCNNLCDVFLFADDAKMYKFISDVNDCSALNFCNQQVAEWTDQWLMKLNVDKCKVLSVIKHTNTSIVLITGLLITTTVFTNLNM